MTSVLQRTILFLALASLPAFALAVGSQAGDNGAQPLGADNEGPREAIPNQGAEAGYWHSEYGYGYYDPYRYYYQPRVYTYEYAGPPATYYSPPAVTYYSPPATTVYSSPPTVYYGPRYYSYDDARGRALANCDNVPLADRPACRDAVVYGGRY